MRNLWCSPRAVGPRKVHVSDVFPCPQWGRAGKWGTGTVDPPERATTGQNWCWSWKWTPGKEGSFPAAVPGEDFLLPLAVNCKSDWATDGKRWGKPEKGEVKNFGRDSSRCEISFSKIYGSSVAQLRNDWGINEGRCCCWVMLQSPSPWPCVGSTSQAGAPRARRRSVKKQRSACPKPQTTSSQVGARLSDSTPQKARWSWLKAMELI